MMILSQILLRLLLLLSFNDAVYTKASPKQNLSKGENVNQSHQELTTKCVRFFDMMSVICLLKYEFKGSVPLIT